MAIGGEVHELGPRRSNSTRTTRAKLSRGLRSRRERPQDRTQVERRWGHAASSIDRADELRVRRPPCRSEWIVRPKNVAGASDDRGSVSSGHAITRSRSRRHVPPTVRTARRATSP